MPSFRCIVWIPSAVLALLAGPAPAETTWPEWRGPSRDGQITRHAWPDSLSKEHLTEQWRVELQPSYSGPIVMEDRVFVTETVNRETERVTVLARADGRTLWQAEWPGAMSVPFFAKANGDWIRATPACDGESLYVAGMRDVLVCLAADTGRQRWRVDFMAELKSVLPAFGFASSPMIHGNSVYVQAGGGFCRLDKETGKLIWRTLDDGGGLWSSAFSSPYLATGEEQWITKPYGKYWSLVANGDKLLALDERGDLYLIRLNPEQFELLDTRKLTENSWAHLAVAGEDVFIRDLAGLTVYRWR